MQGQTGLSGRRWVATAFATSIAIAIAPVACSSSGSNAAPTPGPELRSTGLLVCGPLTFESDGTPSPGSELYYAPAVNAKLAHYPELAAAAGEQSVSDCKGARAFAAAYRDYSAAHPGFETNEPIDSPPPRPGPPSGPPAQLSVSKLLNGQPGVQSGIVKLRSGPIVCTGWFLAKNWIVTADHCLFDALAYVSGAPEDFDGYVPWDIIWSSSNFNPTNNGELDHVELLEYLDFRWPHLADPSNGASNNDLGLLYVPSANDGMLPPDSSQSSLALFTQQIAPSTPLTAWGAGVPIAPASSFPALMTGAAPSPITYSSDGTTFSAPLSNASAPTLCRGDSGGPVAAMVTLPGGSAPQPVVAGIVEAGQTRGDASCTTVAGDLMFFVSIDSELPWIVKTMRAWYGSKFDCTPIAGTSPAVAQCWGPPCSQDSDCTVEGTYCSMPGSYLPEPCPSCGVSYAACDCIKGECLPAPTDEDLGIDASAD